MLVEIKYLGLTFSYHVATKLNVNYITVHICSNIGTLYLIINIIALM